MTFRMGYQAQKKNNIIVHYIVNLLSRCVLCSGIVCSIIHEKHNHHKNHIGMMPLQRISRWSRLYSTKLCHKHLCGICSEHTLIALAKY